MLSRYQLIEGAWDMGYENRSNVVDVYVRYLREKIDRPFGVRELRHRARRRLPAALPGLTRAQASGSVNQTSAPPPGRLRAAAAPPCARAIASTMASPRPAPCGSSPPPARRG